jgi:hypothetical protein
VEKLIYLMWDRPSRDGRELRETMLGQVATDLAQHGPAGLSIDLDDDHATAPTGVPTPGDELPIRAVVSLWLDKQDDRGPFEAVLARQGIRRAGYLVTESLYSDGPARPLGERAPGLMTVTVFDRSLRLDDEAFFGLWFGHQSPMSEWMQPRVRYVRNAVVRAVMPGSPPYAAIVEETWPSAEHITDPALAFGTDDPEAMGENIRIMLDSVSLLAEMDTLRSVTMSDYRLL